MANRMKCIRCFGRFTEAAVCCANTEQCVDHSEKGLQAQTLSGSPRPPQLVADRYSTPQGGYRYVCSNCSNDDKFFHACPICGTALEQFQTGSATTPPAEIITMALTGARNSGKTVFLVGLVESLREMCRLSGAHLMGEMGSNEHYAEYYYDRLYNDGKILGATTPQRQQELIFRIARSDRPDVYVVIRDIAGETIQNITGKHYELEYINQADLVQFMFDPYTLVDVMRALADSTDATLSIGSRGEQVIDKVVNTLIHRQNDVTSLALTIGKFDVIQRLTDPDAHSLIARYLGNAGLSFMTDDSLRTDFTYSDEERAILDTDLRSLFNLLDQRRTLGPAEVAYGHRPQALSTFAVSSLGAPPEGQKLSDTGIAPFRCVDPLMWGYYRAYGKALF